MEATKFLLILGDTEDGQGILDRNDDLMKIREQGLNFSQSPSVGAIYEIYPEDAHTLTVTLREEGYKVGLYSGFEKAQKFFWKSLGFSADGSIDLDN